MHEASVVATELARSIRRLTGKRRFRIVVICLAVFTVLLLVVYRYSPKAASVNCAFRIADSAALPEVQGDAFKVNTCVNLQIAATNSARTLGLSGRQSMPRDQGMLFDFKQPAEYCMWMKDMHISLDMLWLNENKEIIYMIEGVTPDTYPQSFCGPESARYVVEVNSGIVRAADLRIKQRLKF